MQPYFTLKELVFVHFMIGAGFVLLRALSAKKRNNDPPRWVCTFGDGFWGELPKWIQWYTWSLSFFEIPTSFIYFHSGLFYWELAMSPIEAIFMVLGMFVIDRAADLFLGAADVTLPRPNIDLSKPVNAAMDGLKKTAEAGKQVYTDYKVRSTDAAAKQKEENLATARAISERFEELTKGR